MVVTWQSKSTNYTSPFKNNITYLETITLLQPIRENQCTSVVVIVIIIVILIINIIMIVIKTF